MRRLPKIGMLLVALALLLGGGGLVPTQAAPRIPGVYALTPTIPVPPTAVPPPSATPTPTTPPGLDLATATPTPKPPPPHRDPTATPMPTAMPTPTATPEPWITEIRVVKTVNDSAVMPGDTLVYELRAENLGTHTAFDVVIRDVVPDALQVIDLASSQGDVALSGQSITAYPSRLEPGEPVTIRITARVRPDAPAGPLDNTALITTSTPGDDPGNNTSTVRITITRMPPPPRLPHTADPPPDPLTALGPYLPWIGVGLLLVLVGSLVTVVATQTMRRRVALPVGGEAAPVPVAALEPVASASRNAAPPPRPVGMAPATVAPARTRLPDPQPLTALPVRAALDRRDAAGED